MIYTINTSQYCSYKYDFKFPEGVKVICSLSKLPKKNTYISIVCSTQGGAKDIDTYFTTTNDCQLLYKSPMAVNKNPGHGTKPRNTVYVFYIP